MDISIFLAQALGIYLLVISISMFINPAQFTTLVDEIADSPALLFLAEIIALIIGILLVISQNVWHADWRILISIIAWLSLIKGIIGILSPQFTAKWIKKLMQSNLNYYIAATITLLLGIVLSYCGFV